MRTVRGPRPWPVCLFAALFLLAALLRLVVSLMDPFVMLMEVDRVWPGLSYTRDSAIVLANAQFTIACIPVALVWFRAVRFARWLVAVMVVLRVALAATMVRAVAGQGWGLALHDLALLMSVIAAALLFTPAAHRYFAKGEERDAETFE